MPQMVKNLPAMWETWVQSLGQEYLLEKEMETDSRILAWKIPWTKEPGRLQSLGSQSRIQLSTRVHRVHSWGDAWTCVLASSRLPPTPLPFADLFWVLLLQ